MLQRAIKKKTLICTRVIRSASTIKKGQASGKYNIFLHGDNEHIGSNLRRNLCLRWQPTGLQEIS